jgi:hypothetical protein
VLLEWWRVTAQERRQANASLAADHSARTAEAVAEAGQPAR